MPMLDTPPSPALSRRRRSQGRTLNGPHHIWLCAEQLPPSGDYNLAMAQREEYLVRANVARKAAALCADPAQRNLWAKIADQWDALARQTGDLDIGPQRRPEPRSWTE
jgi:hypothetical protein